VRIVIDTGVFIGAAIKAQSVPATAVYQATQLGVLLKSEDTEAELLLSGRIYGISAVVLQHRHGRA